jgi:hypothetical protein
MAKLGRGKSDIAGRSYRPANIEDQVRLAYFSPAPGAHNVKDPSKDQRGGKISSSVVPSAHDDGQREKSLVPGPGSYETPEHRDFSLPEGGRLNRKPPQEKFALDEYPKPAPGAYGIPKDPNLPRQLYGSFGKNPRVSEFIQNEVNRSKQLPAPGEHDVMEAMENVRPFCPEGGRYLDQVGRGSSYFDSAAKLTESRPGPDRYTLPGAINGSKSAGRLVWRYRSETMENTKKIITRVVGTSSDTPAPGQYDVPDPKPLGPAPTLKSRQLGHSMPHPFSYNCAPDHGAKFATPVREQNSGDQIYGRDHTKGTLGRSRLAKAAANVEQLTHHLPTPLLEKDMDKPDDEVQWRSGGFPSMKKAKSAGAIAKEQEHPGVVEMHKYYAMMSKHHGRKDNAFIPNAHRRPEPVRTHSQSDEYQRLQRKKWELKQVTERIRTLTVAALEPLDEQKLKLEASQGLMDKAKFRMRMEGLSQEQQDLVLGEMPNVLLPTVHVYCLPDGEDLSELAHSLVGDYKEEGTNHDRKVYRRSKQQGEHDVYIYYWDDALARREKRDGPEFTGWIIGNIVGGLQMYAECEVDSVEPPSSGWTIDGVTHKDFLVTGLAEKRFQESPDVLEQRKKQKEKEEEARRQEEEFAKFGKYANRKKAKTEDQAEERPETAQDETREEPEEENAPMNPPDGEDV